MEITPCAPFDIDRGIKNGIDFELSLALTIGCFDNIRLTIQVCRMGARDKDRKEAQTFPNS